jgi:mRNA-degrading endonuclease toxin of MazEF toxin-antitoxin module
LAGAALGALDDCGANTAGRRPVLLLSRTPAYEYLQRVLVAEVTTRVRGIPREIPLRKREVKRALGYALDWAELKTLI